MMPESGEMVFNNSPEYIDTNECNHGKVVSGILPYKKGILFMATDALSDWIVERKASAEVIETILQDMMSIPSHEDYDYFIDCARNDENPTKLKDDDTTFIALEFTDIDGEEPIIEQNYTEKFDNLYVTNLICELNHVKNDLEEQRSKRSKLELALKNNVRQINKLTEEVDATKEQDKEREREISTLKTNAQGLTSQINKLQGELNVARREKSSLDSSVSSLKNDKQRLSAENQRLKTDNQRLTKENQQLREHITSDNDGEIAELKNKLNVSQAKEQQVIKQLKALQDSLIELKGYTSISPLDLASRFPFLADIGTSTEVQVTTITVGIPAKDGGFII